MQILASKKVGKLVGFHYADTSVQKSRQTKLWDFTAAVLRSNTSSSTTAYGPLLRYLTSFYCKINCLSRWLHIYTKFSRKRSTENEGPTVATILDRHTFSLKSGHSRRMPILCSRLDDNVWRLDLLWIHHSSTNWASAKKSMPIVL